MPILRYWAKSVMAFQLLGPVGGSLKARNYTDAAVCKIAPDGSNFAAGWPAGAGVALVRRGRGGADLGRALRRPAGAQARPVIARVPGGRICHLWAPDSGCGSRSGPAFGRFREIFAQSVAMWVVVPYTSRPLTGFACVRKANRGMVPGIDRESGASRDGGRAGFLPFKRMV